MRMSLYVVLNLTSRSGYTRAPPNPDDGCYQKQTQGTVKVYIYHLLFCSRRFGSYRSYKREDTCPLMMLATVEKETGAVHHLCTRGRCGTKHPSIAALRFVTLQDG